MIKSPDVFDRSQVIALPSEQHAALLREGVLSWQQAVPGYRAIAYDAGLGSYFFEFEPEADLTRFLSSAYLVTADTNAGMLQRVGNENLHSILPREAVRLGDQVLGLPLTTVLSSDRQGPWEDYVTEAAESAIRLRLRFMGQAAVCVCGEPGCSAEYAWLQNDVCLLYLRIVAVGIREVRLLPFRIMRNVDY